MAPVLNCKWTKLIVSVIGGQAIVWTAVCSVFFAPWSFYSSCRFYVPCSVVTLASKIFFFLLAGEVRLTIWGQWGVSLSLCLFSHTHTHTHKQTVVNNSVHMLRLMQGDKHKLIWIKANRNTLRQLNWNTIPCLSGRHKRWTPCWYQGRLYDLVSASRQLQMTVPGLLPGGNAKQAGRRGRWWRQVEKY